MMWSLQTGRSLFWALAVAAAVALAGCGDIVRGAAVGTAAGATAGAFSGDVAGGAARGAAAGAAAGAVSGIFF
jgi:hypothetical protein